MSQATLMKYKFHVLPPNVNFCVKISLIACAYSKTKIFIPEPNEATYPSTKSRICRTSPARTGHPHLLNAYPKMSTELKLHHKSLFVLLLSSSRRPRRRHHSGWDPILGRSRPWSQLERTEGPVVCVESLSHTVSWSPVQGR